MEPAPRIAWNRKSKLYQPFSQRYNELESKKQGLAHLAIYAQVRFPGVSSNPFFTWLILVLILVFPVHDWVFPKLTGPVI